MRKIIFIVFTFGLCFTTYSQDKKIVPEIPNADLEEEYNDLVEIDEKLDFIFHNILDKQISDYHKLNKKYKNLKEKNEKLKASSSNKERKELESKIASLESKIMDLKKNINLKDEEITKLEKKKEDIAKLKKEEKKRVKSEITLIFKNKGMISDDLLTITKDRALLYQLDQRLISDLNTYIEINKKIIQAQNLLSKTFNESDINDQLKALNNLETNKFIWQQSKVSSLIQLLESYCNKNNDLFYLFSEINSLPRIDNDYIEYLKSQRVFYDNYPFLIIELNKKINNTNYRSSISECY